MARMDPEVREGVIALAGALAERGRTALVLRVGGERLDVAARETDLPGLILNGVASSGRVEVLDPSGVLLAVVTAGGVEAGRGGP